MSILQEEKAQAKDLHPKLLAGMFFFFALGATGGITALLTSDKPIFERSFFNLRILFIFLYRNYSFSTAIKTEKNHVAVFMFCCLHAVLMLLQASLA